ncbi:MAG TPA: hypothetical protein VJV23_10140, partial [Candidatus Polarisedimenticolia bacterium]|nr:hypothetical protein [Candidatus Polarisedimenticolia bacterium]
MSHEAAAPLSAGPSPTAACPLCGLAFAPRGGACGPCPLPAISRSCSATVACPRCGYVISR